MTIENWGALSRDQKISRLARGKGEDRSCPACGRFIQVIEGYWSQHTDQRSWELGKALRQCRNELRPA